MKTQSVAEMLDQLTNQINSQNEQVKTHFVPLRMDKLLLNASEGGWSIAQCLYHLNTYSEYYMPAIQSALEKQENRPGTGFFNSGILGNYFTQLMKPRPGMKKMKAFQSHIPPQQPDPDMVIKNFFAHQNQLLVLIDRSRHMAIDRIKIPISISKFIRLKLCDVLQFIAAHNDRHIQQALKNLGR